MTIPPLLLFAAVLAIIGIVGFQWYRIGTLRAELDECRGDDPA